MPTTKLNSNKPSLRRSQGILSGRRIMHPLLAGSCLGLVILLAGCQEKVVARSGIGADESNPKVSERRKSDPLSDVVWGKDEK